MGVFQNMAYFPEFIPWRWFPNICWLMRYKIMCDLKLVDELPLGVAWCETMCAKSFYSFDLYIVRPSSNFFTKSALTPCIQLCVLPPLELNIASVSNRIQEKELLSSMKKETRYAPRDSFFLEWELQFSFSIVKKQKTENAKNYKTE